MLHSHPFKVNLILGDPLFNPYLTNTIYSLKLLPMIRRPSRARELNPLLSSNTKISKKLKLLRSKEKNDKQATSAQMTKMMTRETKKIIKKMRSMTKKIIKMMTKMTMTKMIKMMTKMTMTKRSMRKRKITILFARSRQCLQVILSQASL